VPRIFRRPVATLPPGSHVFLAICDHFEPEWGRASPQTQTERVDRWCRGLPKMVDGIADSTGRPPQHSFFYPAEELNSPWCNDHLAGLAKICNAQELGSVEVHLHHRDDTEANLRHTLTSFLSCLKDHNLLRLVEGRASYGFVHGNWALDNSRPDGDWCGVNNELSILLETGCYADFTMPAAPDACQTRTVNTIYYAIDDPQKPKSHDRGIPAQSGIRPPADGLLMIQGPLCTDWNRRKMRLLPGLENGDLHAGLPPTIRRLRAWLAAGVHVLGRPDWIFIKLHTHGAPEHNAAMLLGDQMRSFHVELKQWISACDCSLHYLNAYEMAHIVHQAEAGISEPDREAARVGCRIVEGM
jgi:hypothetical protein